MFSRGPTNRCSKHGQGISHGASQGKIRRVDTCSRELALEGEAAAGVMSALQQSPGLGDTLRLEGHNRYQKETIGGQ